MIVLGILGGVGSGKSLAASMLAGHGAVILNADHLGHEVLEEPAVIAALQARWGNEILTPTGQIDRPAVAAHVFAPPPEGATELAFLESVSHPRIGKLLAERLEQLSDAGTKLVVVDAAVMLKAGWDHNCDLLLFLDTPRETRLDRCLDRGWSEAQFDRREASQLPLAEKRARADVIIDNSGTPAQLAEEISQVLADRGLGTVGGDLSAGG